MNIQLICFLFSFLLIPISLSKTHSQDKYKVYTKLNGPGFAVIVIKDGKIKKMEGFGHTHLPSNKLITGTTNFQIASLSKQFTAAAFLLLEQEGRVSADDYLSKYMTDLPDYMKKIKVSHLIHHTSGLPDYESICFGENKNDIIGNREVLNYLRKQRGLLFPPGTRFEYSNSGYVLLSELIQRVTGESFAQFIKETIFRPLAMDQSFILTVENEREIPERAIGHGSWPWFRNNDYNACNYTYGDGGVYTSMEDYSKWVLALQNSLLFKPEFQKKIWQSGKTNDGQNVNYGYGWQLEQFRGENMIKHTGLWLSFKSIVSYFPRSRLWVAVFANYEEVPVYEVFDDYVREFIRVDLK